MWRPEILVPLGAYVLGSFLPATVIAHRRGVDLRQIGRNPGAGDTWRLFGLKAGCLVFIVDAAKGALPLAAGQWLGLPWWAMALTAVMAVTGHNWSVFHRFWGGRGLATTTGVYAFLMPEVLVIALPPSLFAWWRTGWISMSGVVGVPLVLILSWVRRMMDPTGWVTALVVPVLMLLRQVDWIREHVDGRRAASGTS
jgi:glycerol-3-phosphate acyltransferase PlsY